MSTTAVKLDNSKISERAIKAGKTILNKFSETLLLPATGIAIFLFLWTISAASIHTSLGEFPGPRAVVEQFSALHDEYVTENEKAEAFYQRQEVRNAKN